jgi:hypothetical protein
MCSICGLFGRVSESAQELALGILTLYLGQRPQPTVSHADKPLTNTELIDMSNSSVKAESDLYGGEHHFHAARVQQLT